MKRAIFWLLLNSLPALAQPSVPEKAPEIVLELLLTPAQRLELNQRWADRQRPKLNGELRRSDGLSRRWIDGQLDSEAKAPAAIRPGKQSTGTK